MSLSERDRLLIWHPFTQEKQAPLPMIIKQAKGSYLIDEHGDEYLDLISSWWVNIHGHAQPQIAQAIYEQCLNLEHVIFAKFTHEPAVTLCENLRSLLPDRLCKFFFSDNGSTSVEVALKMAYQFWTNKGVGKAIFLSFEGAYHGDTFGSMSVGIGSHYHDPFQALCFDVKLIPYADTWPGDADVARKEERALRIMQTHIDERGGDIAALIVEPLVQCAGRMKMCRPKFIEAVVELARRHEIFVIFDEVAVGFGRTGTNFAFEQVGVVPDFLCLSKGITGGFLPLAVTVTSQKVFDGFLGETIKDKAFLHGHSYTANPVGCAAAITSLELLQKPQTKQAIKSINSVHVEEMINLQKTCGECVKHARVLGTIAAFELERKVELQSFVQKCMRNKIILRPLEATVYLMPPYSTSVDDLRRAYEIIRTVLQSLA